MTVKIAKLFGATSHGDVPPPLPPPNPKTNASNIYYKQQQQQQHYNLYINDDEDDNMSLYSTSASIMNARDHPFNNSQRPLLAEKKTQQQHPQILPIRKKQHIKQQMTAATTYQHQHTQQQQQQQAPYISYYAQQQKRDSVKGLHGFNDFDILSQQFNQHLQSSPYIGYPYGSPPSPTATSSDFMFDAQPVPGSNNNSSMQQHQQQQQQYTSPSRYGNVPHNATPSGSMLPLPPLPPLPHAHSNTLYASAAHINVEHDHYTSPSVADVGAAGYIGKSSRFEDDFCCRRNVEFSRNALQQSAAAPASASAAVAANSASSCSSSSVSSGPFIFGVPHEQQRDDSMLVSRVPAGGRSFVGAECRLEPSVSSDSGVSVAGDSGKFGVHNGTSLMQSTSDTSASSQDSSGNNNSKGAKLLLRKNKSKSKQKQKKTKKPIVEPANNGQKTAKQQTIKCVVVGDGAVGKTNLILSYLENRFIPEHVPTASDIYNADVMVNDNPVHLTLCDTAGQDTLDPLRELCYPDSDVFLLCFSVARPETFHAIKTKWAPKFTKTRAALILVGTQADMRTNTSVLNKLQTTGEKPISYADAWDLATTIGAKYIETSSATQEKVKEVFDTAIWEGLRPTELPPTPPLWKKLFCMA